jgi:GDP-L-fucose synthase
VAECFAMQHGVQSINLLVPNMYGPHDSTDPNKAHALNALVSKFVKARRLNQQVIDIWGTGIAIREWLYAKDFGKIVVHIINNPKMVGLAEPVNIAQNFGLSVRELVAIINTNFDYDFDIRYDPSKPDGAPKKVMDDRKFLKVFPGFVFTALDQGIRNTISYYESVYPY